MTIQTAAPTVRTVPFILSIMKSWLDRPAIPKDPDATYSAAVAKSRAEILVAGKKNLSDASRKRLENALSDFSGI